MKISRTIGEHIVEVTVADDGTARVTASNLTYDRGNGQYNAAVDGIKEFLIAAAVRGIDIAQLSPAVDAAVTACEIRFERYAI